MSTVTRDAAIDLSLRYIDAREQWQKLVRFSTSLAMDCIARKYGEGIMRAVHNSVRVRAHEPGTITIIVDRRRLRQVVVTADKPLFYIAGEFARRICNITYGGSGKWYVARSSSSETEITREVVVRV